MSSSVHTPNTKRTLQEQDDADTEILDFLQMIDDSENKSFDPSTYFQFKEEKDWDTSGEATENETNEIYQNLMNIRFDSLELSLGSVTLNERLDLDDLFLKDNDDSWSMLNITRPIVPKTIKSVVQKSLLRKSQDTSGTQDVRVQTTSNSSTIPNTKAVKEVKVIGSGIKPLHGNNKQDIFSGTSLSSKSSIKPIIGTTKAPIQKTQSMSKATRTTSIKDDDDIDDFLKSLEDEDVKPLPRSNNIKKQSIRKTTDKTSKKSKKENEMEEWLDDVLK
ncbi:hypothetical protein F8M41_013353 [Gigaspora margarita]|uniref:Uncharacterized protein n=1 Tax=Gigaspora margarita TaxID=4874 RepID=A0A8H3WXX2_GIGMA|nr:hypothetical protein F8M41_013353 [Gigaspora margarita]